MSQSFLLFVLAVAISSTFVVVESRLNIQLESVFEREQESDGATTRIVGGTEADPGEYPYFVEMGGCGGALIAPDIVLFAAHCGVQFEGKRILIGSYNTGTTDEGAQWAVCEEYKEDPNYKNGGSTNYDFALCKLNRPVTINKNTVILELNFEDDVPVARDNLIVMGQGHFEFEGEPATVLNHVTVPYLTNAQCNLPNRYNGLITDIMLCAGYPDSGGKDSCQGDSGGPIIQKVMRNGKIVHKHVGVVSWGFGCAAENYPGVYSRTSKRAQWILTTMCNDLNSVSDACDDLPECDGKELSIKIQTDNYPGETAWTLEDSNGFVIESQNNYKSPDVETVDTICMPYDTCYDWTITDSYGDGMCYNSFCGSYSLEIDGFGSVSGDPNFGSSKVHRICSGPASTNILSATPSAAPSASPSGSPTATPTTNPTATPTTNPTANPTTNPTANPTSNPTASPTANPTASPTANPTASPTANPTANPTTSPTANPTVSPTANPTVSPTANPKTSPTTSPTANPAANPTANPTVNPTASPTASPMTSPTVNPTTSPTAICEDNPKFYRKRKRKGCWWVAKKPNRRCKVKKRKRLLSHYCPKTCGICE